MVLSNDEKQIIPERLEENYDDEFDYDEFSQKAGKKDWNKRKKREKKAQNQDRYDKKRDKNRRLKDSFRAERKMKWNDF